MGVVFGLADKIAVLVYGEVIAFDTPEARCAPTKRVQKRIWAFHAPGRPQAASAAGGIEDTDMLKLSNLHAYYGKSHVLHGVNVRRGCSPGEIVACWAATARAAPPLVKPSWAWSTSAGTVHFNGDRS